MNGPQQEPPSEVPSEQAIVPAAILRVHRAILRAVGADSGRQECIWPPWGDCGSCTASVRVQAWEGVGWIVPSARDRAALAWGAGGINGG